MEIDPKDGDFDINIRLSSGMMSSIEVRLIPPDIGVGRNMLLDSIIALGRAVKVRAANARGVRVGDVGSMHAMGIRSKSTNEVYKGTLENGEKIKIASALMKDWMTDMMPDTLRDMLNADKDFPSSEILPCMPCGPGSRIMLSVNLGNSAHYDVTDTSRSAAVWVEEKPGEASNWFFVLPNLTNGGCKGVVIRLRHGVAISWDGKCVYHCTAVTKTGERNNVYGCMWGSGR
jgi:hypothetical protein